VKHTESKLQSACVTWFRTQYPRIVIFAIPNGGNRNAITGAILKREGAMAGVADLFVMKANPMFEGLFIEMKAGKGKASEAQEAFAHEAIVAGYAYYTCRSFDEFTSTVKTYMNL
jgi:hypothetical protein